MNLLRKPFLTLLLIAASFVTISAQSLERNFTLYFAHNSSELSFQSTTQLDTLLALLENAGFYQVELSAHTDQQGSNRYNEILSAKRENSASSYLIEKGVIASRLNSKHFGETVPAVHLEETVEIPANRRVEIKVVYQVFNGVEDLLRFTNIQSEQSFVFEQEGAQEVRGEKGTQLLIPDNAFQTKEGKSVSNKDVVFVLEEFPGLGNAVQHQLSTMSNGKILESGGMFRMEATYQGQELELRSGKKIDVQMPSNNMQKGMKVFVGKRNENGVVDWEETKEEFKDIDTTPAPKFVILGLADALRANRVAFPDRPVYTALDWNAPIPNAPVVPRMPKEPKMPVAPVSPEGEDPGILALFHADWRAYNHAEKQYNSELNSFNKRHEQYERGMVRYAERRTRYVVDSARHVIDQVAWVQTIELMMQDRLELLEKYYAFYHASRFNGILNSLAKKAQDSVLYSSFLINDINQVANASYETMETDYIKTIRSELDLLAVLGSPELLKKQKLVAKANQVDWKTFEHSIKYKKLFVESTENNYPQMMSYSTQNTCYVDFTVDSNARREIKSYEKALITRKKELGIFDRSDVGNVYTAGIPGMGYINCDRFADIPPQMMARLDVNTPSGSRLFVVIPRLNSMIPLYSSHDSTSAVTLPIGEEIKIVSIGTSNGRPTLDYRKLKMKASKNQVHLDPKIVKVEFLEKFLEEL